MIGLFKTILEEGIVIVVNIGWKNLWLLDSISNNLNSLLKCDQSELALVVAIVHRINLRSNSLFAHTESIVASHGTANIDTEDNRYLVRDFFTCFSLLLLGILHLGGSL